MQPAQPEDLAVGEHAVDVGEAGAVAHSHVGQVRPAFAGVAEFGRVPAGGLHAEVGPQVDLDHVGALVRLEDDVAGLRLDVGVEVGALSSRPGNPVIEHQRHPRPTVTGREPLELRHHVVLLHRRLV